MGIWREHIELSNHFDQPWFLNRDVEMPPVSVGDDDTRNPAELSPRQLRARPGTKHSGRLALPSHVQNGRSPHCLRSRPASRADGVADSPEAVVPEQPLSRIVTIAPTLCRVTSAGAEDSHQRRAAPLRYP